MTTSEETAWTLPPLPDDVAFSTVFGECLETLPRDATPEELLHADKRTTSPWSKWYDKPLELKRSDPWYVEQRLVVDRVDRIGGEVGEGETTLYMVTALVQVHTGTRRARFIVSMFDRREGSAQPPCSPGDVVSVVGAREVSSCFSNKGIYLADGIRVHDAATAQAVRDRTASAPTPKYGIYDPVQMPREGVNAHRGLKTNSRGDLWDDVLSPCWVDNQVGFHIKEGVEVTSSSPEATMYAYCCLAANRDPLPFQVMWHPHVPRGAAQLPDHLLLIEDRPIQWIGLRHIGLNLFSADGWMPYDTGQET